MYKLLLSILLALSTTSFCHDPIQEAILNSDYEAAAQHYNAQETSETMQQAYLALADDTAKMRSSNIAFDWTKAFISKKLFLSIVLLQVFSPLTIAASRNFMIPNDAWLNHNERQLSNYIDAIGVSGYIISLGLFISALLDGNKYYHQLQEKIKDAERIKFLIMAQS